MILNVQARAFVKYESISLFLDVGVGFSIHAASLPDMLLS